MRTSFVLFLFVLLNCPFLLFSQTDRFSTLFNNQIDETWYGNHIIKYDRFNFKIADSKRVVEGKIIENKRYGLWTIRIENSDNIITVTGNYENGLLNGLCTYEKKDKVTYKIIESSSVYYYDNIPDNSTIPIHKSYCQNQYINFGIYFEY